MDRIIYLDNSATTRVHDLVAEEVLNMMKANYGNPSSLHSTGLNAERALKDARKRVEKAFPQNGEIVFTSGGTESDNFAILSAYNSKKRESNRVITSTIEHPAVLEAIKILENQGAEIIHVDVDENNMLDMDALKYEASKGAALISIMSVNNETGGLMPLCHIAEAKGNAIFHTDSVQALGKEDLTTIPADLISVSSHKIHGPKGVGALYIKKGINLKPIQVGGGQEKGLRSGTENTPGIVGFGKAVDFALDSFDENRELYKSLNQSLKQGILDEIRDIRINSPEDGCSSILNVSFLGTRGEVILHTLEQDGIMVSTGAACSSGRNAHKSGSHVLRAMGLSEDVIEGAIRFSFGAFNSLDEIPFVVDKVKAAVERFRRLGSFR